MGTSGRSLDGWRATYAELGALLPRAGGEYVYLLEAYGEGPAFLYGWMRFVMGSAGSIASLAVGFATFLAAILPINRLWLEYSYHAFGQNLVWRFGTQQLLAVAVIIGLSALNCGRVVLGGQVQFLMTALKITGIAVLVGGILFFSKGGTLAHLATPAGGRTWTGFAAFGTAMLAALWAYEGWNQMPMVAGEIQNPTRNVPRGLVLGLGLGRGDLLCGQLLIFICIAIFRRS